MCNEGSECLNMSGNLMVQTHSVETWLKFHMLSENQRIVFGIKMIFEMAAMPFLTRGEWFSLIIPYHRIISLAL